MSATQSTLIIPVENQVRELDGKLLLACAAAERGFRVIIGSLAFVEFLTPFLSRGIYLAKSMTPVGQKMLRLIHGLGHDIVAWDEETLVRYDAPDYPNWRFSAAGFGLLDHLFAWGQDDAELFASYHGYNGAPVHLPAIRESISCGRNCGNISGRKSMNSRAATESSSSSIQISPS